MNARIEAVARGRRVAVIGSGFGGLALALRLRAQGCDVTVYEQRDRAGGRAYVYEDAGFRFDAGPTVITDPAALEDLFAATGARLEDWVTLLPVTPFYRLVWPDGSCFDYANDQAVLDAQIAARNPRDVDGYRRFLEFSRAVHDVGYRQLGAVPFLSWRDMARVAPQLARLGGWRSVYAAVARHVQDERLREALSFHTLLVGGHPFRASAVYALIHALEREGGVWFPRGGTGALVDAMVRRLVAIGGRVRLRTPVARIVTAGDRVTGVALGDGTVEPCDAAASNADVVHTYAHLLRDTPRGRREGARLASARHSMSLFVVHFGTNRRWRNLRHHTVLFGPRYRGLLDAIFDGGEGLPDDFSLYLHAPTVTDPSLAPPGHAAHYVLSPVPHLGRAAIDWSVQGPAYRDRLLEHLERTLMPGLRESLVTVRWSGPEHFRDELNAHLGSAFSIEPILTQSAWFRPHNRDDRIRNLYLVGAGTHPGAGIPGVIGSAKATASLLLRDLARAVPA